MDKLKEGIITQNAEKTQELGMQIASLIPENMTLALRGDLGSGKTTLVKGLGREWRITQEITSPTYNIFFIYDQGKRQLLHLDAYRLKSPQDWEGLMVEDFLKEPYCLIVEWPEILNQSLPEPCWTLECKILPNHDHCFRLISTSGL